MIEKIKIYWLVNIQLLTKLHNLIKRNILVILIQIIYQLIRTHNHILIFIKEAKIL